VTTARQVRVAVPAAEAELAADALWQAGAAAIEERPGQLLAGVADGGDLDALLAAVASRWPAEVVEVDLDGALDAWRAHARAVRAGHRLVVRPPWVPRPPGPGVDIVVDPGRAFGHGAHPTTRLALEQIDARVARGERVLDVGCGSGVLAVAALALGASSAVAVDVDPEARAATCANAARNGVADRLAVLDDAAQVTGRFDLVVANMLLPDLAAVAPDLARAAAPGAPVVVSGLLERQVDDLVAVAARTGLVPEGEPPSRAEGWVALSLRAR
jgi:ribosomal protein L11 methyltransferase